MTRRSRTGGRRVVDRCSRTHRYQAGGVLPACDGVVTLRPFAIPDRRLIVDHRDEECDRWLDPGSRDPAPTACLEVDGQLVGWIDADPTPDWLVPGEVNVGYSVFPAARRNGYAARALRLLVAELDMPGVRRALLVIDADNHASVSVARAAGAREQPSRTLREFPTSAVYTLEFRDRGSPWRQVPAVPNARRLDDRKRKSDSVAGGFGALRQKLGLGPLAWV